MSYERTPERWSIVCDGCGHSVGDLHQPSRPEGWANLKHWAYQTGLSRDDNICPECADAIEMAIGETFNERRAERDSGSRAQH